MNKYELNKFAKALAKESLQKQGLRIEDTPFPTTKVDFYAYSSVGKLMKIKVRSISQIGSYVFSVKRYFDIEDSDLYMAVLYIPLMGEVIMYLVPAVEWGKGIYPFKGKDYGKVGQVSEPEWGISFSRKAKDAMESYRFSK